MPHSFRLKIGLQAGRLTTRMNEFDAPASETVTALVHQWVNGDEPAGARLFTRVYDELRLVARAQRRRWVGEETLDTTALVHEVYLRLNGAAALSVVDRAHFFAIAARATRQVLSNYARTRSAGRRGDGADHVSLDRVADRVGAAELQGDLTLDQLWALESALQQLHALHPRPCRVVECRFFGGLSIEDTAVALAISPATVKRDWLLAQTWLYRALAPHRDGHD